MSDTKKTSAAQQTAPPEAYAAFVRIYMDWLGRTEDEQIALVEKSVRSAERANTRFGGMGFLTQRNGIIYETVCMEQSLTSMLMKFGQFF